MKWLEEHPIIRDVAFSLLVSGSIGFLAITNNVISSIQLTQLSLFITIFVTIMGFLITILTIIFAFEDSFSKNQVVQILKSRGLYKQIYSRFIDTTLALFYSIIILSLFFVFYSLDFIQANINLLSVLLYVVIFFGFLRIYRAFYLFRKLQNVISLYQQQKEK